MLKHDGSFQINFVLKYNSSGRFKCTINGLEEVMMMRGVETTSLATITTVDLEATLSDI